MEFNAILTRSVGGVYYADALDGDFSGQNIKCAARGIFRAKGISPCAGDMVKISVTENSEPLIAEVLPRRNFLPRPPLANLDRIILVNSTVEPKINRLILDKLIAVADSMNIEPFVVFTKIDLEQATVLPETYRKIGIKTFLVNNISAQGADGLREELKNGVSAFVGNSGVGKSSLLNTLYPEFSRQTGEISKKLGRGKHTTRESQLFKINGGYIADTPGFSTVDVGFYLNIEKNELSSAFREFGEYARECRFSDCKHIKESGCAVRTAVDDGEIARSRYESYLRIYEELSEKNIK